MSGYECQFCPDGTKKPATVLMTWLSNGASIAMCDDDLAPALINITATDLGVDPGKLYETVSRFVNRAAKAAHSEAGKDTPGTAAVAPVPGDGESIPADDDDTSSAELAVAEIADADDAAGIRR